MDLDEAPIVDWEVYERGRAVAAASFVRDLSYFRDEGVKAVDAVEAAVRQGDAALVVSPAYMLKSASSQFGAERLSLLAEYIELEARRCIETRQEPDELIPYAVKLRPLFRETIVLLDDEANPLVKRRVAAQ